MKIHTKLFIGIPLNFIMSFCHISETTGRLKAKFQITIRKKMGYHLEKNTSGCAPGNKNIVGISASVKDMQERQNH